jgi:hypothetical protein
MTLSSGIISQLVPFYFDSNQLYHYGKYIIQLHKQSVSQSLLQDEVTTQCLERLAEVLHWIREMLAAIQFPVFCLSSATVEPKY